MNENNEALLLAEREAFYDAYDTHTKKTGHRPAPLDVWLMARGVMDTSGRHLVPEPYALAWFYPDGRPYTLTWDTEPISGMRAGDIEFKSKPLFLAAPQAAPVEQPPPQQPTVTIYNQIGVAKLAVPCGPFISVSDAQALTEWRVAQLCREIGRGGPR